jgi:chromosome transmission fidelity protein 18
MRWLKHWDFCVFGKPIPKASSYHSHNRSGAPSGKEAEDAYQRPTQRLLMLHGPPGLGKTTLAHVAAQVAGYEVIEINASDERSGSAAEDRIVEVVESVGIDRTGRRGKERCVIVDECDGGDTVSQGYVPW